MASIARGRGRGGGRHTDDPIVRISKAMSYVLRHGAAKDGIPIRADGYVLVDDLLKHPRLKHASLTTIQQVVQANDKQRFTLVQEAVEGTHQKVWLVRANQGHTLQVEVEMQPITSPAEAPIVVHGTYAKNWPSIQKHGLKPMARQHIHFAPGKPGENGVIRQVAQGSLINHTYPKRTKHLKKTPQLYFLLTSGMRSTCDVFIYIDMAKALADGIPFLRSANNVILSAGKNGVIGPEYFLKVER
ncbi:tRNA 2'-phosphotransferase [Spizellomyces punctatus DAOM BR117]|uniref:2'-phosphotransferase n=1 Tax=Spizellomyces punctatus (strain DAOM BR117) TaxID=645134 RepID=A0A0L0HEQ9_SPIPD|nr:tRNA 2'-phosphotransferase [Spizellomyces punctatus DAOM BR117]KNC99511.1 hypothetical protein SPPG_09232 [Spizellomyces punctatus DAOM BR117]|eukprot:XP_016607551.1 hypothetical protein SPPG_09232 [Spizellomyces punctatus DAOM BR117]